MGPSPETKPRVLIIGAGLGGLALAQSLRKKDIPFGLFERDSSDGSRSQGWAISLHSWFIEELLAATKDDMPKLETVGTTYEIGIPSQAAIFDAHDMSERMRWGDGVGQDFIRADRAKLREWLPTDLNVHWGKRFSHYEQNESGVRAYFDDGSSYPGDILVGADGINSLMRNQLIPDPNKRPQRLPMGIVVGELLANEDQYQRWSKIATSFFIGKTGSIRLFVGLKSVAPDRKSAKYYWIIVWMDKQAEKEDFWTVNASKEELRSFTMNSLDGVHPDFAEIFRATPVEGMLHPPLQLRDMTPPKLPRGRVTLLGDATHAMVPFRGEGGNMAMKDAFSLASVIEAEKGNQIEDMLKVYESEMRPRTTKSVLASRIAGDPSQ